jgi:glyceraldehyde 3-phosphate dehydrogenase
LIDGQRKANEFRKTRSATINILPISSKAAKTTKAILKNRDISLEAFSLRVPVANITALDIDVAFKKEIDLDKLKEFLKQKTKNSDIINYSNAPLVSSDIVKTPYSAIIDSEFIINSGRLVKFLLWQDNEYAYAKRVVDTIGKLFADG